MRIRFPTVILRDTINKQVRVPRKPRHDAIRIMQCADLLFFETVSVAIAETAAVNVRQARPRPPTVKVEKARIMLYFIIYMLI